jgi:MoaA/NifB/PqqE/SkfB family radical SAM enzyme
MNIQEPPMNPLSRQVHQITGSRSSESGSTPEESYFSRLLSESITSTFLQATRLIASDLSLLPAATRFLSVQKNAADRRNELEGEGIQVPAVIMLSITGRCNLACTGCYMQALHRKEAPEMTREQIRTLVNQGSELGVSVLVLAGGEPLVRKDDILTLAREFPDMIIAVYTNGVLIDQDLVSSFRDLKNIIPLISIEGEKNVTDARRSEGVYDTAMRSFSLMKRNCLFFGCSVTITRMNFDEVTGDVFVSGMIRQGCRIFSYVEYVPIQEGTGELVPDDSQRAELIRLMAEYQEKYSALFISFPGDEKMFGGCLSAGRGFLHISPSGDLEPCPAAPFSDVNITRVPLKEALRSRFLSRIRDNHSILSESEGGCALWKNREWVWSILE